MLADDHKIMRDGLRALLEKEPDIEVIGEAENGQTAIQMAQELLPDIVIMDVLMPDLNGIEATQQIIAGVPSVKVVALSMYSERRSVVSTLKAGASVYLIKDCAAEELVYAIRAVALGRYYLSPSMNDIQRFENEGTGGFSALTVREREVLRLLAEGRSAREIADQLSVSPKTIEMHRSKIMEKLNIHSVAELTKYAISEGITSLGILPE